MPSTVFAVSSLPNLLAEVGAGVTIVGGLTGFLAGGASRSRQSLEDLALGAAIGGFLGCLISFLIYFFATVVRG
jgi:hypothetical protein